MPELPEVEELKDYFNRTSRHKKIAKVACRTPALLKKVSCKKLNTLVSGKEFDKAYRRGKFIIAPIKDSDYRIIFHFGMTGFLRFGNKEKLSQKDTPFAQIIFTFSNKDQLLWCDIRKFGRVYVVKALDDVLTLKNMGPEALELTKKEFLSLLETKQNKNIKAFLMDQKSIAGIGNDYSNETLFQASISPKSSIKVLSKQQREKIYTTMKKVLTKAISIKPLEGSFPPSWLLSHKDSDMKCPKNSHHTLKKSRVSGRTAIYCPVHQK